MCDQIQQNDRYMVGTNVLWPIQWVPFYNIVSIGDHFYASVPKVPEALCFRVVRPSGFFHLRDNSSITWWNFITLGQKVKLDVTINWLDFEWDCVAGGGGGANVGQPPPPPPPPSGWIFCLRDNSSITWWNFIKLGQKVKLDVTINWLDFEWDCVAGGGGGGG